MKEKIKQIYLNIMKHLISYVTTNRLFLFFVISSLVSCIFARYYTIGNLFDLKPLIVELAMILIIGSFGYLIKGKNQFYYFFSWAVVIALINIVNSVYFVFYQTFTSFGLLGTVGQLDTVGGSVMEKLEPIQFIYILGPLLLFYVNYSLSKWNYYNLLEKVEKGKRLFVTTMLVASVFVAITLVSMKPHDYSRLTKQWDRYYLVERFGIIMYQFNDLFQIMTPKFNSLFGYEEAAEEYRLFYAEKNNEVKIANRYTDKYKGYNIIFIHMESIQRFLLDLSFNGEEVLPTLNNLIKEGMYFNNFHSQISIGTSSDTEFTLLTSLMPAQSGTVFVTYSDREFITLPKLLQEEGYYTFSTHGNKSNMWNRDKMHPNLGYQEMFFEPEFELDEVVNLGITDKSYFRQLLPMLENIEEKNELYMGTIITLSNHSPFYTGAELTEFDLTHLITTDEEGNQLEEPVINPYLENTKMGEYIKSSHYADEALGELIEMIKQSDKFNKTLFVFYGDHDAKLSRSEFNYLYNYDPENDIMKSEEDIDYVNYDYFAHEINRSVPLVLWTKDKSLRGQFNYPMGMLDVFPTLSNMIGINNKYSLGYDIFSKKDDNIVIFPNGNILTSKVYYNNAKEQYVPFTSEPIDEDYITNIKDYTDQRLKISNNIIVHDLIKKEREVLEGVSFYE